MKTQPWAIALVSFTTLLTSAAQILYKIGSESLVPDPIAIITNYYLVGGLSLYMVGFLLLMVAYRGGEASVLYPIFASSYVWVVLLGYSFLGESLNFFKVLGVLVIVLGISIIAKSDGAIAQEVPA